MSLHVFLEGDLQRLRNVHAKCIEKNGKVMFLHQIIPGGADNKLWNTSSQIPGLPDQVIARAKGLLTRLESNKEGCH